MAEMHGNAPTQSSTRGHFHLFKECLLQKLLGNRVGKAGSENRAGEVKVGDEKVALTIALTTCPAVEPSGDRKRKYKALIKIERGNLGFL
jgi:hypothetical protein